MNAQVEDGFFIHSREILAMIYRRRIWLMLTVLAGALLSIGAIMMQKQMYTSSATLLIDSQQIPTTLVASPLTSIANERIAKIRQQIVSRESLSAIIREHGLYPSERKSMAFDDVLNIMRGAVGVELVGASQGDANTGRTIAFTLSFTYENPDAAQAVTRTLTELFLREDKRFRTEQATGTAAFLGRRADELRRQLEQAGGESPQYRGALCRRTARSGRPERAVRGHPARRGLSH